MEKIVKVRYSEDSNPVITDVMLESGQQITVQEAITMAKNNQIENVNVGMDRLGFETLRSNPDGDPDNNLSNLDRF